MGEGDTQCLSYPRPPIGGVTCGVTWGGCTQVQAHVWVKGGCEASKCGQCQKKIKSFQSLTGLHCVWCHLKVGAALRRWEGGVFLAPSPAPLTPLCPQIHEECLPLVPPACDCGILRDHILPPAAIYPVLLVSAPPPGMLLGPPAGGAVPPGPPLSWGCRWCWQERQDSQRDGSGTPAEETPQVFTTPEGQALRVSRVSPSPLPPPASPHPWGQGRALTPPQPPTPQVSPVPNTHPLLVFVNPKSGGKQGER